MSGRKTVVIRKLREGGRSVRGELQKNDPGHDEGDPGDAHERGRFAQNDNPDERSAHRPDPGPDGVGRAKSGKDFIPWARTTKLRIMKKTVATDGRSLVKPSLALSEKDQTTSRMPAMRTYAQAMFFSMRGRPQCVVRAVRVVPKAASENSLSEAGSWYLKKEGLASRDKHFFFRPLNLFRSATKPFYLIYFRGVTMKTKGERGTCVPPSPPCDSSLLQVAKKEAS